MIRKLHTGNFSCLFVLLLTLTLSRVALAQTTAFTYQGKLTDAGNPANGNYDLQFKLFDTLSGGAQQGATLVRNPVAANAGVFTVTLDFGTNVFSGAGRFLEIGVRPAGSGSVYTMLAPRQTITSSPYAIQTLNAQQLGGLPASAYLTTASAGTSFIKNDTAQQSANLNISGNGFFGGNVGIGTVSPLSKLAVQTSGYGLTHTSGTVTLGTFISTAAGGSGWLGTKSNHSLNFFTNDGLPQMTIDTSGNVGIGTTAPTSKLYVLNSAVGTSAVFAQSGSGRGVWGKSTSSIGVFGESTSLEGVFGVSSSAAGVRGASTSNSGVYGESPVSSLTAAGVYGKGTGSGSIGVIGEANVNNAVGVFGVSSSATGFGVYARNLSGGRAIIAEGDAAQSRDKGGFVKAMLFVLRDGTIARCYNGMTGASTGNCGFSVNHQIDGFYDVNFGFQISDRFLSITPILGLHRIILNIWSFSGNVVTVNTQNILDEGTNDAGFYIIVF